MQLERCDNCDELNDVLIYNEKDNNRLCQTCFNELNKELA